MREKDFQNKFNKWLKANYEYSAAFELKITKGNSLPFSAVKQHQIDSLLAVQNYKLIYKIADDSIGFKPFDCFCMRRLPAYIVILFYKLRQPSKFYAIRIDKWIEKQIMSDRKSLVEEKANLIAEFSDII